MLPQGSKNTEKKGKSENIETLLRDSFCGDRGTWQVTRDAKFQVTRNQDEAACGQKSRDAHGKKIKSVLQHWGEQGIGDELLSKAWKTGRISQVARADFGAKGEMTLRDGLQKT